MLTCLGSVDSLVRLSAANWVDIICLTALCLHLVIGYFSGFARMLASVTGMLVALQGGYWLYPTLAHYLRKLPITTRYPLLGSLFPYLLAVILGLIAFLLLRLLLHRFFRLLVEQPVDRIFGILSGFALGLMGLFLLVSVASMLPESNRIRLAICRDSRTGRIITPALQAVLEVRPQAVIRFPSDDENKKQKRYDSTHKNIKTTENKVTTTDRKNEPKSVKRKP